MRFQVAVDRNFQRAGEERKADFIDVTAWRQTAEFVSKYFRKGSMIAVEGSIQTDNFTDKDGNKRKSVQVVASNVSFCGSKAESGTTGANSNPAFAQPAPYEKILPGYVPKGQPDPGADEPTGISAAGRTHKRAGR